MATINNSTVRGNNVKEKTIFALDNVTVLLVKILRSRRRKIAM